MTDHVRQGQTEADIIQGQAPLVTLDVVSHRFAAAGLPRSMRTLQRYCANGTLLCVKEVTETGDTYFVVETSIETAIIALKQLHAAKSGLGQAATEPAMAGPVALTKAPSVSGDGDGHRPTASDADAEAALERQAASAPDMTGHVALVAERLAEKDAEIAFLREELIDRRGQIKDMKGIIDGQNQLLEAIQTNVAPIFKALAATVEAKRIDLSSDAVPRPADARDGQGRVPHVAEAGEAGAGLTDRHGSPETRYL
ncbi:MAG: hypothetical protein KDJ41_10675 [Hyphomicrobiaceae bacterium]|nr:hypothetical protein [Hyphomicrobiaceae bacterium]